MTVDVSVTLLEKSPVPGCVSSQTSSTASSPKSSLPPVNGLSEDAGVGGGDEVTWSASPGAFNFYNYLRTHPLLVRQQLAAAADQGLLLAGIAHGAHQVTRGGGEVTVEDRITPVERR